MFTLVILFWNLLKLLYCGILQKESLLKSQAKLLKGRKASLIMSILSLFTLALLIFSTTFQDMD
jgi:hypothetical protein